MQVSRYLDKGRNWLSAVSPKQLAWDKWKVRKYYLWLL